MAAVNRRELLQVGCSGMLGLTLPAVLGGKSNAAAGRKHDGKSVILVFLTGGASHLDTFDPKPDAAANVRGEFSTIATKIAGVRFSEHLPKLAARADRLAVVRSMAHRDNRHLSGTHNTLTGVPQQFRGNSNEDKELDRRDRPCYGSVVGYLHPREDGLPSGVTLPNRLVEGSLTWPGQHAGLLGAKYDPWQLQGDPTKETFDVSGVSLPEGMTIDRVENRRGLLDQFNRQKGGLDAWARRRQFTAQQDTALAMLTSGGVTEALHIERESAKMRDRYGRHKYGQTLLLARRFVEAGVPVIQANMGIVQTWDTHSSNFPKLKDKLLPPLDQAMAALMDDLDERGLLEKTLIIAVGEFGRTPRISKLPKQKVPGRDHWAWGYTAVFAGGGVRGGQVIGRSDKIGAYPITKSFHPSDIGATVYHTLGINTRGHLPHPTGLPTRINDGRVIGPLYDAAQT